MCCTKNTKKISIEELFECYQLMNSHTMSALALILAKKIIISIKIISL